MLRLNTGVGPAAMRYHRRMALKHAQTRCHGSSVPSVVSPSSMTSRTCPVVEQNCERCGRPLIRKSPADMAPPDFIASPDYVVPHCVVTAWRNTAYRPIAYSARLAIGQTAPIPISSD